MTPTYKVYIEYYVRVIGWVLKYSEVAHNKREISLAINTIIKDL